MLPKPDFKWNFIVWHRGAFGVPYATLDRLDPRSSLDWPTIKQGIVDESVTPLTNVDQDLTFDEVVAKYPAPAQV